MSDNKPTHPSSPSEIDPAKLKEEYDRFIAENRQRSDERQAEMNREIEELRANQSSFDLLSLIVRYNYEDGFYDNYPTIVADLVNKGKITLPE